MSDAPAAPGRLPRRRRSNWIVVVAIGTLLAAIPFARTQEPPTENDIARQNAIIVATLVRTTLVALHQANVTGNYTVLRDLAAPSFRDRNSAADLAGIFAPIRGANIDLGAVVVLDPRLTAAPAVDDDNMLRVEGTLETEPASVAFQLLFQAVDGAWRLFGVSINPVRPVADAPVAAPEDDQTAAGGTAILPGSLIPPMPRPRPPQ